MYQNRIQAKGTARGMAIVAYAMPADVSRFCPQVYAAWNSSPRLSRLVTFTCRALYQESPAV